MVSYSRTVFITGGLGFIGSNYLNKYVELNQDTLYVNIDSETYAANHKNVTVSGLGNYRFHKVDIADKPALAKLFKQYKPDCVIHFAAESHVDRSINSADDFIRTNVVGTQNLLDLSLQFQVTRFHFMSTDEVYGAFDSVEGSFSEESPLQPRNPYSASKAAGDLLVQSYGITHELPVVITRCSNVFGPNQDSSKLIPHFILKLRQDEKVPLYGEGLQVREWTFVSDCVEAVHAVFSNGDDGEVYNIGTGNESTNLELTKMLLKELGKTDDYIEYVEDRKGHDYRYSVSTSKIHRDIGWKPKVSFEEGLKRTIESYK